MPMQNQEAANLAKKSGILATQADISLYLDAQSALIRSLPLLEGISLPFEGVVFGAQRDEYATKMEALPRSIALLFNFE